MPSTRTRVVALAWMMVSATICAAVLAQSAMALASGQDCVGPGCEDQIACGQPTIIVLPLTSGFGGAALVTFASFAAAMALMMVLTSLLVGPAKGSVLRRLRDVAG